MFTETQRELRGHDFVTEKFLRFPRLYSTEEHEANVGYKLVWAHFFTLGMDWWLIEYDPTTAIAFGFVCLGGAAEQDAEFGNFSLIELESIRLNVEVGIVADKPQTMPVVIERDLDWKPIEIRAAVPKRLQQAWWTGE
jgi:hypothetical protein